MHTFYVGFQRALYIFFIQLEVYDHLTIFQHITRSRSFPDVSFFNHVNHLNFKANRKIGLSKWN